MTMTMMIADLATIIALVAGPVLAVYTGRWLEKERVREQQKWKILRDLMRYRSTPLSEERVGALNLIEIEFHDDKEILEAWKNVLGFFGKPEPESEREKTKFYEERDREQMRLIELIALKLKVKLDRDDISKNAYAPIGWANLEHQQETIRHLLIEMLRGNTPIQVVAHLPPEQQQEENDGTIKELPPRKT